MTFVQRNFHGLTLNAGYTFSRDLATPKGGNDPYITNSSAYRATMGFRRLRRTWVLRWFTRFRV